MERVSDRERESERSSRRSRDDQEKSETRRDSTKDHHHHHHHHHRDRDSDRKHRHRHSERHDEDDERRHRSRADSPLDLEPKRERSLDRDLVYRDSVERDRARDSVDRGSYSRKRKDHDDDGDYDGDKKRSRAEEEPSNGESKRKKKREGRRFEDSIKEEDMGGEEEANAASRRKESRGGRRFGDKVKEEDLGGEEEAKPAIHRRDSREERRFKDRVKEENGEGAVDSKSANGDKSNNETLDNSGSTRRVVVAQEPLAAASEVLMTNRTSSNHSHPNKVSSITTTNENEGVSIIRSDEVHGKSSTDGAATSSAGKSGSLSLDALAKAKKALQMQKELAEKLKKIRGLNKLASTSSDKSSQVPSNKDGQKVPAAPVQVSSSSTSLPLGSAVPMVGVSGLPGFASAPTIEAVKRAQELAAKMGYRHDPEFAPLINMFPGTAAVSEMPVPQRPSKAPVLRLDAQGREVDEHGNVINMPKLTNLSTLKVNINKQKKEAFQILKPALDADIQSNPHFDARMGINKTKLLRPKRMSFQFVDEGKWSKQAEIMKIKNQFGEAQAKELKVKQSQLAKAKAEPDENPNLIAIGERVLKEKKKDEIPDIEWWDKPLLPIGAYTDDVGERLNIEKITIYLEHPRPIEPPAEPAPPPPQPLKLTKKEQKKLRTQRRLAKERDRQEMIRQGLLEPPKPKVKMSNLMKVLGSEATQDPTRMEMEIRSAAAEREQAHVDRNIARKLTPAERREKKERKLFDDPSTLETIVSVYKVNDLSHPQTRFKVDVNAQENRLTGCVVMSDGMSVVVVEGGKKAIKRYGKLMLKRINWAAAVGSGDEDRDGDDGSVNSCFLVWQGSVARPSFHRFLVHQCRSDAAARKVFADAGVPHYWDLAANFSEDLM